MALTKEQEELRLTALLYLNLDPVYQRKQKLSFRVLQEVIAIRKEIVEEVIKMSQ